MRVQTGKTERTESHETDIQPTWETGSLYDEKNEMLKVTVNNPGGADYLDIIVDGEVRETLRSPEPSEETTVDKKPSESIEVKRRGDPVIRERVIEYHVRAA